MEAWVLVHTKQYVRKQQHHTSKALLHVPKELSEEVCVVTSLAMQLDDQLDVSEERKYHDVWNACPPSGT